MPEPTEEELKRLLDHSGPSAIAFLRAISEPHASSALDATVNGAFGGMICGGAAGTCLMPFYSLATRSRFPRPKAGVLPYRMAQAGFMFGGSALLGLSALSHLRGKHDALSTVAIGSLGGASVWRFSKWLQPGGAPRALLLAPGVRAGSVLAAMSGVVVSSLMWSAQTAADEEALQVDSKVGAHELSELWVHGADPWADSSGVRELLSAARGYVEENGHVAVH